MFEFVTYSAAKLQILLLVSFRAAGLFISAPILGHRVLPPLVKAGLAIILAIILIPVASQVSLEPVNSIWLLAVLAAKEMLIGFIIGFFFSLLFLAIQMGGGIVGYQIGLAIGNVLDPEFGSEVSIVGEFWVLIASLIFLSIDGHHAIISAFADSYRMIPVGVFNFSGPAGENIIRLSSYAFVMAIKISAPVVITLFLTEVALGVVARTVPQMNIFIVGIPLKIGIGFLILAISLPVFRFIIEKSIGYLDMEVIRLLHNIGTA
ncbi:MAG: flagellar biosynthetic protein FliR [candidate division Zixibacteria bacterium]|nr:flagellar biosynthetic protein FliR [candidate division Zixibacteria bacterium]